MLFVVLEIELNPLRLNRRSFIAGVSAGVATAAMSPALSSAQDATQEKPYEFCTFIKFLQDLSYERLAETLKNIGLDGAEVTVRKRGYISPESAADELPKLAEVFKRHDLKINIVTTDIVGTDSPHAEAILKTTSGLGISNYRMGFHRYDLKAPIGPQLASFKPRFGELAALNRESGVSGGYQNHAGGKYLGATFWDLRHVLSDIPPEEIGCIFDIRHAVAEGSGAWPIYYDIIKPHINALSAKDFHWALKKEKDIHLSPIHCPLGKGQVNYEGFLRQFMSDFEKALVTLHIEYLPKAGVEANIAAINRDFGVLQKWMGEKNLAVETP